MFTSRLLVGFSVLTFVVAAPVPGTEPAPYEMRPEGSGWRAACPPQGFDAVIGPAGVRVSPRDGTWEFALELERIGRDGDLAAVAPVGVSVTGPRAELRRGPVVEWYVNSASGLEQGFTLHERPDGKGPPVLELALGGDLLARAAPGGRAIDLYSAGSSLAALSYGGLVVEDADGRRLEARLELGTSGGGPGLRIVMDDGDAAYPVTVDSLISGAAWSSTETDATGGIAWGDWDGDGDLDLAVGNYGESNRVYSNTGTGLVLGGPRSRPSRPSAWRGGTWMATATWTSPSAMTTRRFGSTRTAAAV